MTTWDFGPITGLTHNWSTGSAANAERSRYVVSDSQLSEVTRASRSRPAMASCASVEDAHQVYWNREVGQLRARVRALESLVRQAAETRAGQLDVQVRTFGPAAGRAQSSGKSWREPSRALSARTKCWAPPCFSFWLPGLPRGWPMNAKRPMGAWRPSSSSGQSCARRR